MDLRTVLAKPLRLFVNRFAVPREHVPAARPEAPAHPDTVLEKAARFVACEMIEGDYLEFGVYRGATFVKAYRSLERQFHGRIALNIGGDQEETAREERRRLWSKMRFFAFDSFEGLPPLGEEDAATPDFQKGQYACSVPQFQSNLREANIPLDRTRVVQGWFSDTCTRETREEQGLEKAAIVWIDADLYSSAKTALQFVTDLLQDGTVIIFDDWFSFKGSPYAGEQRAFHEWTRQIEDEYVVNEYQRDSWKRMSFIVSKKLSVD